MQEGAVRSGIYRLGGCTKCLGQHLPAENPFPGEKDVLPRKTVSIELLHFGRLISSSGCWS